MNFDVDVNSNYFNRRNFILGEFEKLNVSLEEGLVLLMIDYFNEFNNVVNYNNMSQKLGIEENEVERIFNNLIEKNLLEVKFENYKVVYSIENIFNDNKNKSEVKFTNLFDLFEMQFGRPLSNQELLLLREWISKYDKKLIEYALKESVVYEKVDFNYINAILEAWNKKGFTSEEYEQGKR